MFSVPRVFAFRAVIMYAITVPNNSGSFQPELVNAQRSFNLRIIFYGHLSLIFCSSQARKNAKELAKGVRLEYIDR